MDIYRKELNQIYASQHLELEVLKRVEVEKTVKEAEILASVSQGCTVITDASCDRCYIFGGNLGRLIGFFDRNNESSEELSSDEDRVYSLIHPEDLVDKRLLEYEFFKLVDAMEDKEKLCYKAVCKIRMKNHSNRYHTIDNTTQVIKLSPRGKIWLILCTYNLSASESIEHGIEPAIINTNNGVTRHLFLSESRIKILSEREKEILRLIQDGMSSKLIADKLNISIHTVNRHRQNIITKLSVSNSYEAITAAKMMKLL